MIFMMQSIPEKIFKKISKEGFYKILKPLGFKRKGNRFCLMNDEYGKVVDLQKSQWNSKDRLSFTITDLYKIEYR
ncbi:PF14137 domain protein [Leptospira noguchii str. Bonito]|nr:PF14137 domain protein [Leptospira noguchii str. Bonito]